MALAGYQLGRSNRPVRVGSGPPALPPPAPRAPRYLPMLSQLMGAGRTPPRPLLEAAYLEARALGNREACGVIEDLYLRMSVTTPAPAPVPDQSSGESGPEVQVAGDAAGAQPDDEPEPIEARVSTTLHPLPADRARSCPIDGIDPGDWAEFVATLRVREPEWSSDKAVGAYEHNRKRLRQLDIHEAGLAGNEAEQYRALCTDVADYYKKATTLIGMFTGDVVEVGSDKVHVTLSGMLGLLKIGGPKGAESWLTNPTDRTRYPRTTEAFLRCNGCF